MKVEFVGQYDSATKVPYVPVSTIVFIIHRMFTNGLFMLIILPPHLTDHLRPIMMGVVLWGKAGPSDGSGSHIEVWKQRAMHLKWSLLFFLASYNVILLGEYIPGVENGAAQILGVPPSLLYTSPGWIPGGP